MLRSKILRDNVKNGSNYEKSQQRKKLIENKTTRSFSKILKVICRKDKISILIMYCKQRYRSNRS